jgi:hypothetical protein
MSDDISFEINVEDAPAAEEKAPAATPARTPAPSPNTP